MQNANALAARGKRVLLVHENANNVEKTKYILESHGFETIYEACMYEGLHRLLFEAFDLVLLSFTGQHLRNFALCEAMRAYTCAPIIVLCETEDTLFQERCMEIGVDSVLTPPHTESRLIWQIYFAIGMRTTQEPWIARSYIESYLLRHPLLPSMEVAVHEESEERKCQMVGFVGQAYSALCALAKPILYPVWCILRPRTSKDYYVVSISWEGRPILHG